MRVITGFMSKHVEGMTTDEVHIALTGRFTLCNIDVICSETLGVATKSKRDGKLYTLDDVTCEHCLKSWSHLTDFERQTIESDRPLTDLVVEADRRNRQMKEAIESGRAKVYNTLDEDGFIRSKE